jgi:hypothetical protein
MLTSFMVSRQTPPGDFPTGVKIILAAAGLLGDLRQDSR